MADRRSRGINYSTRIERVNRLAAAYEALRERHIGLVRTLRSQRISPVIEDRQLVGLDASYKRVMERHASVQRLFNNNPITIRANRSGLNDIFQTIERLQSRVISLQRLFNSAPLTPRTNNRELLQTEKVYVRLFEQRHQGFQRYMNQSPLRPRVNPVELHALNELFDLKKEHYDELQNHFDAYPLTPRVQSGALNSFESQLNRLKSIREIRVNLRSVVVNDASSVFTEQVPNTPSLEIPRIKGNTKSGASAKPSVNVESEGFNLIQKSLESGFNATVKELTGVNKEVDKTRIDVVKHLRAQTFDAFDPRKIINKVAESALSRIGDRLGAKVSDVADQVTSDVIIPQMEAGLTSLAGILSRMNIPTGPFSMIPNVPREIQLKAVIPQNMNLGQSFQQGQAKLDAVMASIDNKLDELIKPVVKIEQNTYKSAQSGFPKQILSGLAFNVGSSLYRGLGLDQPVTAVGGMVQQKVRDVASNVKQYADDAGLTGKLQGFITVIQDILKTFEYKIGDGIAEGIARSKEGGAQGFVEGFSEGFIDKNPLAVQANLQYNTLNQLIKDINDEGLDGLINRIKVYMNDFKLSFTGATLSLINVLLNARRQAGLIDRSLAEVDKRFTELNKEGTSILGDQSDAIKRVILVAGGTAATGQGSTGIDRAASVQKAIDKKGIKDTKVVGVKNEFMDFVQGEGDALDYFLRVAAKGYSPDAVEMVAQALKVLKENPKVEINLVGESGGGFIAQEAVEILKALGINDVKYYGAGTPNRMGFHPNDENLRIGLDEPVAQQMSEFGVINDTPTDLLGVTGHLLTNYLKSDPKLQEVIFGETQPLENIDKFVQEILQEAEKARQSSAKSSKIEKLAAARAKVLSQQNMPENAQYSQSLERLAQQLEDMILNVVEYNEGQIAFVQRMQEIEQELDQYIQGDYQTDDDNARIHKLNAVRAKLIANQDALYRQMPRGLTAEEMNEVTEGRGGDKRNPNAARFYAGIRSQQNKKLMQEQGEIIHDIDQFLKSMGGEIFSRDTAERAINSILEQLQKVSEQSTSSPEVVTKPESDSPKSAEQELIDALKNNTDATIQNTEAMQGGADKVAPIKETQLNKEQPPQSANIGTSELPDFWADNPTEDTNTERLLSDAIQEFLQNEQSSSLPNGREQIQAEWRLVQERYQEFLRIINERGIDAAQEYAATIIEFLSQAKLRIGQIDNATPREKGAYKGNLGQKQAQVLAKVAVGSGDIPASLTGIEGRKSIVQGYQILSERFKEFGNITDPYIEKIKYAISEAESVFESLGRTLPEGFIRGLGEDADFVTEYAARVLADEPESEIKRAWGIASPSKVAVDIAKNIVNSFVNTIASARKQVQKATEEMSDVASKNIKEVTNTINDVLGGDSYEQQKLKALKRIANYQQEINRLTKDGKNDNQERINQLQKEIALNQEIVDRANRKIKERKEYGNTFVDTVRESVADAKNKVQSNVKIFGSGIQKSLNDIFGGDTYNEQRLKALKRIANYQQEINRLTKEGKAQNQERINQLQQEIELNKRIVDQTEQKIKSGKGDTNEFGERFAEAFGNAGKTVEDQANQAKKRKKAVKKVKEASDSFIDSMILEPVAGISTVYLGFLGALGLIDNIAGATGDAIKFTQEIQSLVAETGRLEIALGALGKDGKASLDDLFESSRRLNISFGSTAKSFRQFLFALQGTKLQNQTQELFSSFLQAVSVRGLNTQQQENAMMALIQMASKGRVSMEELNQQLSEALPGALSIAAKAFGYTTEELAKLIATGDIQAEDFLPKFLNQASMDSIAIQVAMIDGLIPRAELLGAKITAYSNSLENLMIKFGQGMATELSIILRYSTNLINTIVDGFSYIEAAFNSLIFTLGIVCVYNFKDMLVGMYTLWTQFITKLPPLPAPIINFMKDVVNNWKIYTGIAIGMAIALAGAMRVIFNQAEEANKAVQEMGLLTNKLYKVNVKVQVAPDSFDDVVSNLLSDLVKLMSEPPPGSKKERTTVTLNEKKLSDQINTNEKALIVADQLIDRARDRIVTYREMAKGEIAAYMDFQKRLGELQDKRNRFSEAGDSASAMEIQQQINQLEQSDEYKKIQDLISADRTAIENGINQLNRVKQETQRRILEADLDDPRRAVLQTQLELIEQSIQMDKQLLDLYQEITGKELKNFKDILKQFEWMQIGIERAGTAIANQKDKTLDEITLDETQANTELIKLEGDAVEIQRQNDRERVELTRKRIEAQIAAEQEALEQSRNVLESQREMATKMEQAYQDAITQGADESIRSSLFQKAEQARNTYNQMLDTLREGEKTIEDLRRQHAENEKQRLEQEKDDRLRAINLQQIAMEQAHNARMAQIDAETKALQKQENVIQSQISLLQEYANSIQLDKAAVEQIYQKQIEKAKSPHQKEALEKDLRNKQAQFLEKELAIKKQILELEIQREKVAARRSQIESQKGLLQAELEYNKAQLEVQKARESGDKEQIAQAQAALENAKTAVALAREDVDLASQQVSQIDKIAKIKRANFEKEARNARMEYEESADTAAELAKIMGQVNNQIEKTGELASAIGGGMGSIINGLGKVGMGIESANAGLQGMSNLTNKIQTGIGNMIGKADGFNSKIQSGIGKLQDMNSQLEKGVGLWGKLTGGGLGNMLGKENFRDGGTQSDQGFGVGGGLSRLPYRDADNERKAATMSHSAMQSNQNAPVSQVTNNNNTVNNTFNFHGATPNREQMRDIKFEMMRILNGGA